MSTTRKRLSKLRFTSKPDDHIDCEGCLSFFMEDEVSVTEAVINGIRDFFILCSKCCSRHGVNKKPTMIYS